MLIAIEGVDGAGKNTLTQGLRAGFEAAGRSVTSLAFPRYHRSVHADLAAEALHGGHGDLSSSVYAMAVLFALDRADARDEIGRLSAAHDVVILDRYVASNAAYSAARLHQGVDGEVVAWVRELEFERFGLPAPDWQVLLAVPTELAGQRAQRRAEADAERARDAYERDDGLQRRTNEAYAALAAAHWGGPWVVAGPDVDAAGLARTLAPDRGTCEQNARCGIPALSRFGDTMDTMRQRILVVDDDPSLAEMLTIVLRGEGFDTAVIGDGTQALTAVRELRPDLVLLDLMLPGMNGIDVCRVLRADSGVPIVMLTAKTDTVDVVLGLESGADDYVMKPFKQKELVARVRARLRRNDDGPAEMLSIADIDIDVPAHKVTRMGEQISLTPLEFDLLVALARKPRQVFTRDVLLEQVWGYRHPADTRLVNVHVQRLRAKVEKDPENPQVVLTVRGVGYKAGPP